jgi:hypothetical protein
MADPSQEDQAKDGHNGVDNSLEHTGQQLTSVKLSLSETSVTAKAGFERCIQTEKSL